jgi:hypothetical protein
MSLGGIQLDIIIEEERVEYSLKVRDLKVQLASPWILP